MSGLTSGITLEQIENWFTYHKPNDEQQKKYLVIRENARAMAQVIVDSCPPCADTTAAIRLLRQAVMTANQAIACDGR